MKSLKKGDFVDLVHYRKILIINARCKIGQDAEQLELSYIASRNVLATFGVCHLKS